LAIDFQNLVRTIVDDGVTRSRTAISRNQNAAGELNARIVVASVGCHVGCCVAFCGIGPMAVEPNRPLRRSSEGKSSAAPEKFWSIPTVNSPLLTRALAIALGWWDRPCAFSLRDPLYPVAKRPANAGRRHRLVWSPRSRFRRLLNALRHEKTYEQKFETQAARRAESLTPMQVDSLTLAKTTVSAANPLVR